MSQAEAKQLATPADTASAAVTSLKSNTVPTAQNQALHEKAVKILANYPRNAKEVAAGQLNKDYNKRRREITAQIKPILQEIWDAFDRGETVGGCTEKQAWCKQVGVLTYRRCRQILTDTTGNESKVKSVKVTSLSLTDIQFSDVAVKDGFGRCIVQLDKAHPVLSPNTTVDTRIVVEVCLEDAELDRQATTKALFAKMRATLSVLHLWGDKLTEEWKEMVGIDDKRQAKPAPKKTKKPLKHARSEYNDNQSLCEKQLTVRNRAKYGEEVTCEKCLPLLEKLAEEKAAKEKELAEDITAPNAVSSSQDAATLQVGYPSERDENEQREEFKPAKVRPKLKKPLYREGVDYVPAFLSPAEADELLELMKSQPFADCRVSYGPQVFPPPRKNNAWKDRYALAPNPQPEPEQIRSLRMRLSERYGVPFNSVQCNWHGGNSEVKAHYDPYRIVAMVRLAAARTFEVGDQRRNGGGNFKPYPMPHGSLITFLSGGLAHRMFPDPAAGDCVSLVFRLVTPPQTVASWHDKPIYGKTRAAHKKLYDAAVSEYRSATDTMPAAPPTAPGEAEAMGGEVCS